MKDIDKFSNNKKYLTWFKKLGQVFKNIFIGNTVNKKILRNYLYAVLVGTILLMTPWAVSKTYQWNFLTALFTASSAFSDTGLSLISPAKDLTFFGQIVLLLLIQIGGIGIMTLKIILFIVIGKNISIEERMLLQSERGNTKLGGTVQLIKNAFYVLAIVEITGGVMLFFYFYFTPIDYLDSLKSQSINSIIELLGKSFNTPDKFKEMLITKVSDWENFVTAGKEFPNELARIINGVTNKYNNNVVGFLQIIDNDYLQQLITKNFNVTYRNFGSSFWSGIFHSVSATNNAGFDIIGPNSLSPYRTQYFVQVVFLVQLIIGGIGYPVFYDLKQKSVARYRGIKVNFSLFTKISVIYYFSISFIGILAVILVEYFVPTKLSNTFINGGIRNVTNTNAETLMAIIFNTFSTRSAGYSTIDISYFKSPSKFIFSILMWIGASPSSTGGGIRTTTLALVMVSIIASATRKNNINMFKAKVPNETAKRATAVFIMAILIVFLASLIIISENVQVPIVEALFISSSAFGTAGLTMIPDFGLSFSDYSVISKLFLISLMFIGQLGVSNTLLLAARKNEIERFAYLEQDVPIG
ncbi:TrkH family potassium uptake protein [Spiroplasma endosymbiont of 'Nebria riversi']|uniref:TrkH family potassium uptake protein n=1 Tax=Spiroplasma endosymbiont of 'Nebria riversi' TaxID=2792084 RepID=UPI001C0429C5|nr:potassium transporter TrkG [Spiroplasma endosymbiont of 'Nebria riversi']